MISWRSDEREVEDFDEEEEMCTIFARRPYGSVISTI